MAHRSQCSSAGDNPLDPNYLPPHYREEYRMAIDALVEVDLEGYYGFLQKADVVDFLSCSEIEYIKCMVQAPHHIAQPERRCMAEDVDGSSDTYWPVHSDHDAPSLDLGWPQQFRFIGPTEVTTLVNPPDPEMPSIKEQVRRMIKNAKQVIAVVMDMFTDVDIFADILGAAKRGVAVYVLLDEMNAHHFVAMVNNCRVNLDEIKFMRVRTVSGSTYHCRTGKTFKGQMMDRFILVDCRAVLSGNYSFMWSFEKIHRCLAHLFLGQLVTTFDEEFRILFAHSEPLVVENVLANMQHSSGEPESYYNTEKTHMLNREYPTMGMELAGHTTEDSLGYKMLPFRSESIHSAAEANPSIQRNMNLHAAQQYRGDHQFIEHGRQMRGPNETVGSKGHSSENIPDYEYIPPENHLTIRGRQYMEGAIPHGGHFAQEPRIHKGAGLQSGYDMYGRCRGQGQHIDQFSGPAYPHEVDKDEPPGAYDHIQRYLQSQPAMEEGHDPINLIPPVQSNLKRHSMGHSYTCQTSPTQPNPPEQKHLFNVNRKAQDVSQKQGLRDWRISSYLSAYDDAGELDLAELEGSTACDDIPCFTQEAPCGPIRPEIRLGNREFNRIPSPKENTMFAKIQNNSIVPDSSVNHPYNLSQRNIKTTPASTSESSCTTEGDKVEETQNREHKETSRISEEFLRRKPNQQVQRSSRLRHSLIFSSNLDLHASEEMKDTGEEKDGDEASKLSARVSQILDKRRTGSPFQPFQWSSLAKPATFDNSASESAQPEDKLNKMGETSDVDKVTVPGTNSQRDESNLLQKSSSFIDMNDPDCRLRYFKELAAKRKLAAAKASQSNPMKATQKFTLPEKPSTIDADKETGHVFKIPETPLKSKNTSVTEIKETYKDTKCEESSKDILHRATDAEKIRFKKQLAEMSGSSLKNFKGDIEQALKEESAAVGKNVSLHPSATESGTSKDFPITTETDSFERPTAAKGESSHHFTTIKGDSSQHQMETDLPQKSTALETDSSQQPTATATDSSQQPTATETDSSQEPTATETDSSQKPTATETDSSQQPTATETGSSQQPTATETDSSQKPTATETDPSQQPTATENDSSQQPTATETDSSQKPTATETGSSQQPTAKETGSSQQPTATETDSSQKPTATETDPSQQPTATENDSSQQPTATETDSSQQPTATETDSSQQPTAAETGSSQQPTATETDSSQQPTATETDSSQQPTATETDSSQQPTATETGSSQQPTATERDSSQQPTATERDSSQQPTAIETGSSQQPTATERDSSQQPTATETGSSQQPTAKETGSSQQPTATETDSSQKPTATETDPSQQPTATERDSSQQPTAIETGSSQQPTATETDSSQQPTAAETGSSQQPTATETDSSQQPTATETDSSQQPTATETDSSQQPTATETGSSQQPTATERDSSQQPTATERDSSQQPTAIETGSSQQPTATERDSSQQPTATETGSSQKPTATATDSSQQPTATQTDSSQQPTATKTDSSQQPTATETDSSQQPIATETNSSEQPTATENDNSWEPIAADTDSSQQPTAKETDPSQQPTATDKDSSQQPTATVTDSSDTDFSHQPIATETDSSPEPTAAVINTYQKSTSTVTDSFQKNTVTATNSFQQSVPTETDSSQHLSITESELPQNPTKMETDTSKHPIETKNESLQGITANNNLRDDTKVLLEQISAKNQSRSSQSKQTLDAPNEAKKGEAS
ncbi:protein FAM83H-like [Carassius carassius]|uniref:protein FAM83H-like n=1 Tax=Carassius carassius TaxID=217509 RepID=UPI00286947B2|nr:protein FAM83H-like [Carassius carassius]